MASHKKWNLNYRKSFQLNSTFSFFLAPFTNSRRRQSLDQHPFFQKFNIYLHFEKNQTPLPRRKLHELNERIYLNELDEEIKVNQILFRIQTEINWKAFIFGRLNEIMNLIMPLLTANKATHLDLRTISLWKIKKSWKNLKIMRNCLTRSEKDFYKSVSTLHCIV